MKIVLDTNIIISASIWGGKPGIAFSRVTDKLDVLFITDDILDEIEDKRQRPKFYLFQDLIGNAIAEIKNCARKVTILPEHKLIGISRDPKDDKFIECALAAQADYIISGDKHLHSLKEYKGVKIVTVADYLEIVNTAI